MLRPFAIHSTRIAIAASPSPVRRATMAVTPMLNPTATV